MKNILLSVFLLFSSMGGLLEYDSGTYQPVDFTRLGVSAELPDGTLAEIIQEEGQKNYAVFLTKNKQTKIIHLDEEIYYGAINQFGWLDQQRLFLEVNVNPSVVNYVIVDLEKELATDFYLGSNFTWNQQLDTLYYIRPVPHGSEPGADEILDNKGNVFFVTRATQEICSDFFMAPVEPYLAFYVRDLNQAQTNLIVLDLVTGQKIKEFAAPLGEIHFIDQNCLRVKTDDTLERFYSL